jgi:hypothetical protein
MVDSHENNQYYLRGKQLARKVVELVTEHPDRAAMYAQIWVPACLVGVPYEQKLGFLDIACQAESTEIEDVIFALTPFVLSEQKTMDEKLQAVQWLKQYYERFTA